MPLLTRATRQRIQAARIARHLAQAARMVRNTSRRILPSQRVRPEQQAFEQLPVEIEIDISEATTMSSVTEQHALPETEGERTHLKTH